MKKEFKITLILILVILLLAGCVPAEYRKGVQLDRDFPEKILEIYDNAIIFFSEEDDDEITIKVGSEDDVEDVIEFYQELFEDEDKIVLIDEDIDKDDKYQAEGIIYDEEVHFEMEIEEASSKNEKKAFTTVFEIVIKSNNEIAEKKLSQSEIIILSSLLMESSDDENTFTYIDDLPIIKQFETLFISQWNYNGKTDPFTMGSNVYTKGIAMFIPLNLFAENKSVLSAVWRLDQEYYKVIFDMGCEQSMGFDVKEKYGIYKVIIYANNKEVWNSGYCDYDYLIKNQEVIIGTECSEMEIELVQYKGTDGTLNVILGNFRLFSNLDGE